MFKFEIVCVASYGSRWWTIDFRNGLTMNVRRVRV